MPFGHQCNDPYKQLVIPYCDEIDPKAKAIGAVNTIVNRGGKLYGYNTDYAGFAYLARAHNVDFTGKTVLILGTGGTHSTVEAVCRDGGAGTILSASRTGKFGALTYNEAMRRRDVQIIVNTTPCGMYPNVGQCLLDPTAFPALEAVLDVVYNPFRTELLLRAEEHGITAAGGFEMLVAQAVYAAQHFTGRFYATDSVIPTASRVCAASWPTFPSSACRVAARPPLALPWPSGWARPLWTWMRRSSAAPATISPISLPGRGGSLPPLPMGRALADVAKHTGQIIACGGGVIRPRRPTSGPCARTAACCGSSAPGQAGHRGRPLSPRGAPP